MELNSMLRQLWRHRLLSALVVVVAVAAAVLVTYDISGSGLKKKHSTVQFGAAETQFFVDTRRPTLITSQTQAVDLIARANILGRFISSGAVRDRLGAQLGIPATAISVIGPTSPRSVQAGVEPVAQQRATQLLGESSPYSIAVDVDVDSPTVTLFVQAPDARRAKLLAAGVPTALTAYLTGLTRTAITQEKVSLRIGNSLNLTKGERELAVVRRQKRLDQTLAGRTVIRPLGQPVAGAIATQSSKAISLLVFIVVLLVGLLLVVVLSAVGRRRGRPG